jgi:hypothetical protein
VNILHGTAIYQALVVEVVALAYLELTDRRRASELVFLCGSLIIHIALVFKDALF